MRKCIESWTLRKVVLLSALLIFLLKAGLTLAQEDKPLRIYMDIMCYQKNTGIDLKATVRARIGENRKIMPVSDIPISFYNITDSIEAKLGSVISNDKGESFYTVTTEQDLFSNEDGVYTFSSVFEGNDRFNGATKKMSIKEARIEIAFIEVDSVKIISAKAFEIDQSGSDTILNDGIDLSFYIPGSFSLYKIGEAELNDGVCTVEFPITLPGDSEGNLTIIARIEESDDFGFVEGSAVKDWGMVRETLVQEERRGLGDTDAPLWMTYTLIVLLSAVWLHYLYIFVVIYLIKKDSKTAH